jgi:hypothetical protein
MRAARAAFRRDTWGKFRSPYWCARAQKDSRKYPAITFFNPRPNTLTQSVPIPRADGPKTGI